MKMKNEDLFIQLVKAYIKATDKYDFSAAQWKQDYSKTFIACEKGVFESYQQHLIGKMSEVFPYMFADKVIPMLDKDGNAVWKVDFNLQLNEGAVFLFVAIGINKKVVTTRIMANKEMFNSKFELTDIIIKHERINKSATVFENKKKKAIDYFLDDEIAINENEEDEISESVKNVSHTSKLHLPAINSSKPTQQPFVSYRRSHQYTLV
ncbi:hypothetical protein [Polynucleobacter sp. AM-25C3]|uniref:hypothetical protein n=1 Tax=Polynucleobacter sp. AM-25C3 TaxID=1855569 RepID=UPI001C0E505C|nr:hypothetical protein [Polynucleobacter sp. AM-25C3]MBU3601192.1 hypothetical protein [Polynucleobacter sp. AM-25C3]